MYIEGNKSIALEFFDAAGRGDRERMSSLFAENATWCAPKAFCEHIAPRFVPPAANRKWNREQTVATWEKIKKLGSDESQQSDDGPAAMEILSEMRNSRC